MTLHYPDDLAREMVAYFMWEAYHIAVQEELDVIKVKHKTATQKVVQVEEPLCIAYEDE